MDEAIREQLARLNAAWQAYDVAAWYDEDETILDTLNEACKQACAWLAAHGYPWETLVYDAATSTFSLPADALSSDERARSKPGAE
jgi:hypothetical protein